MGIQAGTLPTRRVAGRTAVGLTLVLLTLLSLTGSALAAPTITEFPLKTANREPLGIAAGPDGDIWFTEYGTNTIGRSTLKGEMTEFTGLSAAAQTIVAGSDGNLWFTEQTASKIGRITPAGTGLEQFSLPSGSEPLDIVSEPGGDLWFTEQGGNGAIGRISTTGTITQFTTGLTTKSRPEGIAPGPEGDLWFTEAANPGRIGQITPNGTITEYALPIPNTVPRDIVAGADGNLWFTQAANPGEIGRITPGGTITEFTTGLTTDAEPLAIAAGNDGNVYFTEPHSGEIGEITPSGVITQRTPPTVSSEPDDMTTGPDGNIWFTEEASPGKIAVMTVAPKVSASAVSEVAEQTATLQASVGPNSQASTYEFEYGTTSTYGSHTSSSSAGSGASSIAESSPIGDLQPAIEYHFRVVATNGTGTTYGPDQTFTTTTPPTAVSQPATTPTLMGATLNGTVDPEGQATVYNFEWGTTTAYGNESPAVAEGVGSDTSEHQLAQSITGLQPGTLYHYRIVATNCGGCAEGTSYGVDQAFTTESSPVVVSGEEKPGNGETGNGETGKETGNGETGKETSGSEVTVSPGGAPFTAPVLAPLVPILPPSPPPPVTPPALGHVAVAQVLAGTVLIRLPGAHRAVALTATSDIPVGALVDAEHGTLVLTTAVNRQGLTQPATVWGGSFVLHQSSALGGMTTFVDQAPHPSGCPTRGHAGHIAEAAAKRHETSATLWSKDDDGHFSTRGQNSVATVRGTYWGTRELCDGTLTTVRSGLVSVRSVHTGRTVLVSAGHSYLARS